VSDESIPAVAVPYARLPADVLARLVEEFVTRDGTDYGAVERTLQEKIMDVTRQLEHGDVVIVYDETSDTTNIVARRSNRRMIHPDGGRPGS